MADFASMLKYLRERDGLSQRELAEKLQMSAGAIGMYESGKRHPKFEDEEAIADFFNVDLNTLRGRRTYEGELDMAQVEKAMSLYNVYLTVSPDVRSAIDVLLRSAQQVSQATAEIPSVKATKPRAEFPYLKKDTK